MVSQLKAYYGAAATKQNDFGYDWHPKLPQSASGGYDNWSWAYIFDHMFRGEMEGLFSFGMNPVSNGPHSRKAIAALAKLNWMVVVENFEQETSTFWKPEILDLVGLKPEDVKTEVFLLPASNFAEKDGSFVNSARWIQWKWKAVDPPGDAKPDQEIVARIFLKVRELYQKEGGTFPEPIHNLNWWYTNATNPSFDEVCKELNGWVLEDVRDPTGAVTLRAGQQLSRFADARADGSTLSGNWLYIGMYTDAGNLTQRRSNADPSGLGRFPEWTVSWPANRRVLYNRASADAQGRPWDPTRIGIAWNGQRWVGDTPDYTVDSPPDAGLGAFIMNPEGVARLFVPGQFVDGPWSEHYEPAESPVANPLHPEHSSNPAVRPFGTDFDVLGTPDAFPIVCTTYRLTEHLPLLDQEQSVQRAAAAGVLRRDSGGAGAGKRDRQPRSRARHVGSRLHRRPGDGDAAHQADADRGSHDVSDRVPDSLGLPRTRPAARIARQPGHANRRRSEFVRAGVQGFPCEAGKSLRQPEMPQVNDVRVSKHTGDQEIRRKILFSFLLFSCLLFTSGCP